MAKNKKERKFDQKLISVYNEYGVNTFLEVCTSMLGIRDKENAHKKMLVNGEICEVVIRVLTEHYLVKHSVRGKVFHSLVLPNLYHPERPFRTELDFTVLTPYFCVTAECKSFVGDITVVGKCTLTRQAVNLPPIEADVDRQTQIHVSTLRPYLEKFVKAGAGVVTPPLYPICFLYSRGTLLDQRSKEDRNALPVLDVQKLFRYYDLLCKKCTKEVYDVKKASEAFQAMADSRILHIQHANYLGY